MSNQKALQPYPRMVAPNQAQSELIEQFTAKDQVPQYPALLTNSTKIVKQHNHKASYGLKSHVKRLD